MARPIVATIHLDAFRHNLFVAKRHAPHSKIMAVVKANGYGHGLLRSAQGMREADGFAVLNVSEGVVLREAGFTQDILLLEGVFGADDIAIAGQYQFGMVVHNDDQIRLLELTKAASGFNVFLKVNTGMNRLGFPIGSFRAAYDRLKMCPSVKQITLMTHFSTADEGVGITDQLARFNGLTENIRLPKSLANSAALLRYPETHADWVRPGIMLYGATPFSDCSAADIDLKSAMTLSSQLIAVQNLQPGDSIGYGQRFTAEKAMRIGVVACGYADGYPRHAPNGTPVSVAGSMTRTLGRVSMDMLHVDITEVPDAAIGSPVELWGRQVPVDKVAESAGTVGYELLCALAPRVPVVDA